MMHVKKAIQNILLWRGLNFLSLFILNVLLARYFGASEAGALFFVINNLSLVILILSFSLELGLTYYVASGKIDGSETGMLALIWCITAVCIFIFFPPRLNTLIIEGVNLKIASICFITGNLLINFYSSLFFARNNFITPNGCLLAVNLILITLFISGMQNAAYQHLFLYAYMGSFFLQGIVIAIFYFLQNKVRIKFPTWINFKLVVKFSLTAFVGNIIFFLVYRVDYWFVETYSSANELGNYIQVSKIVQWFLLVPTMISTVLFPFTATGQDSKIIDKIVSLSRILLWLYFFVCIGVAAIGFWAFVWMFGDTYTYMYTAFLLYIPGVLALVSLFPILSYHAGIKRIDIKIKGALLALLIIVVLNAVFTPEYGIYAASAASSIGYIVYYIYVIYYFKANNEIKLYQLFRPLPEDALYLKSMFYKRK